MTKEKTMKDRIRQVIVARNTLVKMSQSVYYKNSVGMGYLNLLASDLHNLAKSVHPLLPYYLATKAI